MSHILAGALQVASPQRVKAAVKAIETPPELVEHMAEVVNVCRAVINAEGRIRCSARPSRNPWGWSIPGPVLDDVAGANQDRTEQAGRRRFTDCRIWDGSNEFGESRRAGRLKT